MQLIFANAQKIVIKTAERNNFEILESERKLICNTFRNVLWILIDDEEFYF
jgi:hypothetical protein